MAGITAYQARVLRWCHALAIAGCISLVVATLYVGQVILMPVALAIVLSFLLQPAVRMLERLRLWRVPAVIVVVLAVGAVFAGVGWHVMLQFQDLAHQLHANDRYVENLDKKIEDLQGLGSEGMWTDFQAVIDRVSRQFRAPATAAGGREQAPVMVQAVQPSPWESTLASLAPLMGSLGTAVLVGVLLIFMLIDREDLRNRIIGLFGQQRLANTTHAIDDAGHRIGRYLLMQFVINASYGVCLMIVLGLIGVPFAVLWGLLAAILRYIPYVGPWLGASLPIATSLVAFEGWQQPLLVLCFVISLELLSNMVMEPLLYGHSVGLSPVALIISAAFWTLLWGPIGLVLATPLTVCLVVLGQHVPQLRPFAVLLSDTPALPPPAHYYQRLLARDRDEAARLVLRELALAKQVCQVFDSTLVPALLRVRRDRHREELSAEDANYVFGATREIIAQLAAQGSPAAEAPADAVSAIRAHGAALLPKRPARLSSSSAAAAGSEAAGATAVASPPSAEPPPEEPPVLACAAHHEVEELVSQMLGCTLREHSVKVDAVSTRVLCSDLLERVSREQIQTVFIAVVPPSGMAQAAYLCQQFRKAHPQLTIIVGCWGRKSRFDEILVKLRSRGADYVTTSLCQTQAQVLAFAGRSPRARRTPVPGETPKCPAS